MRPMPQLALTDEALKLVLYAEYSAAGASTEERSYGRITAGSSEAKGRTDNWLQESALLRLVSVVEAYVDAATVYRLSLLVDNSERVIAMLVRDLELSATSSWQNRQDYFSRYHGFALSKCSGWTAVRAGVEVRNCITHGLGRLTAQQRAKTKISAQVAPVDVTVSEGRMLLSKRTVPTLAKACRTFLLDTDSKLVLPVAP